MKNMCSASHYVITFGVLLVATLVTSEHQHRRDVISTPAETDTLVTSQHLDKRIVNGQDAQPGSHPYIASLQINGKTYCSKLIHSPRCSDEIPDRFKHLCGGTLIHESWVVTAAHCVEFVYDRSLFDSMRIVVGEHDMTDDSCPEQTLEVEDVIVHSGYNNQGGIGHDIALIKLKQPVKTNAFVKIATVSTQDCGFVNSECVVVGWGVYNMSHGNLSDVLQEVATTVISNDECEAIWDNDVFEKTKTRMQEELGKYIEEFGFEQIWDDFHEMYERSGFHANVKSINPGHVCIMDQTPPITADSCYGDSGGPIMCGPDHNVLVGITSWGNAECTGTEPAVNTRVSAYLDFIRRETEIDV